MNTLIHAILNRRTTITNLILYDKLCLLKMACTPLSIDTPFIFVSLPQLTAQLVVFFWTLYVFLGQVKVKIIVFKFYVNQYETCNFLKNVKVILPTRSIYLVYIIIILYYNYLPNLPNYNENCSLPKLESYIPFNFPLLDSLTWDI